MASVIDFAVQFLLDNILYFVIVAAAAFGIFFAYRFLKKIPKNPDYVRIWNEQNIEDEKFNKTDTMFGYKFLFRGERLLGKILTFSNVKMSINPTPEDPTKYKEGKAEEIEEDICTVVFKPHTTGKLYLGKKTMIKFLKDDVRYEGKRIAIPENYAITALGNCYFVHQSLPAITKSIEANWSRRFAEAQANAYGQQMLKVSGFITEYAQERRLRELEIDKLKAEKQLKMGTVI